MLLDRMFIHTKVFDRKWNDLGCNDDDLIELQKAICKDPKKPPIIQGTGGIRKIRITLPGRGKSSGARVLYIDYISIGVIGLLSAYPKNKKIDITDKEKKILKSITKQIADSLEKY